MSIDLFNCHCVPIKSRLLLNISLKQLEERLRMPKKDVHNIEAIKKAADICGSLSKLAIAIGANYTSAFKWVHGKAVPSPLNCMRIEKATRGQVKKEEIRPDFDWKRFKLI